MSYSFEYIDIILLAMIAGFIFLRLRSILGKKTGFEGKAPPQFDKILKGTVKKQASTIKDTFDKNDYARLTGEKIGGDEPQVEEPSKEPTVSIPTPTPSPSPLPLPAPEKPSRPGLRPIVLPQMGDGSQTQVVNQDNDVNTNVTGNENVTNINQDNSVRQYGAYGSAADRSKALRDKYVADISKFTTA